MHCGQEVLHQQQYISPPQHESWSRAGTPGIGKWLAASVIGLVLLGMGALILYFFIIPSWQSGRPSANQVPTEYERSFLETQVALTLSALDENNSSVSEELE